MQQAQLCITDNNQISFKKRSRTEYENFDKIAKSTKITCTRIDHILVTKKILQWIEDCDILDQHILFSDHKPVICSFQINDQIMQSINSESDQNNISIDPFITLQCNSGTTEQWNQFAKQIQEEIQSHSIFNTELPNNNIEIITKYVNDLSLILQKIILQSCYDNVGFNKPELALLSQIYGININETKQIKEKHKPIIGNKELGKLKQIKKTSEQVHNKVLSSLMNDTSFDKDHTFPNYCIISQSTKFHPL